MEYKQIYADNTKFLTKWDTRFLNLAKHISSWSKDPSSQVGSIIANNNRVCSLAYNGFCQKVNDSSERLENRDIRLLGTIHAEENAILFSSGYLDNCSIYVWPFPPCASCMSKIIQVGITKVYAPKNIPDRWKSNIEFGFELASEANVKIILTPWEDGV